jgi:PleD family two-component response regulator
MNESTDTMICSASPPDVAGSGSRPRLLVVDDQPVNIQILNEVFNRDYEVFFATCGSQALEMCRSNQPDLVLLDVLMPSMKRSGGLPQTEERPGHKGYSDSVCHGSGQSG